MRVQKKGCAFRKSPAAQRQKEALANPYHYAYAGNLPTQLKAILKNHLIVHNVGAILTKLRDYP